MSWIICTNQAISLLPLKNEEFSHFCFFTGKKNIIFCIKKNLFNFLWGIAADTSLDGSIYCVLFAWLPCLPPFARDCFVRDFFLTPTDFSMVSWIFTKKSFRFFVFQQSWYFYCTIELLFCFYGQNKTIFCIFQTYKNYFSCFFIVPVMVQFLKIIFK